MVEVEVHSIVSEQFDYCDYNLTIFTESPNEICCGALPFGKCCYVKLE